MDRLSQQHLTCLFYPQHLQSRRVEEAVLQQRCPSGQRQLLLEGIRPAGILHVAC
jgi:hypothetical protein